MKNSVNYKDLCNSNDMPMKTCIFASSKDTVIALSFVIDMQPIYFGQNI